MPASPAIQVDETSPQLQKLHAAWKMLDFPLVIGDGPLVSSLRNHAQKAGWERFKITSTPELCRKPPLDYLPEIKPDSPAMLPLTSGSTGMPKAVCLTHRNILAMSAGTIQANAFSGDDLALRPISQTFLMIRGFFVAITDSFKM